MSKDNKYNRPYMTNEERNFYIAAALALAGGSAAAYFTLKKRPIEKNIFRFTPLTHADGSPVLPPLPKK